MEIIKVILNEFWHWFKLIFGLSFFIALFGIWNDALSSEINQKEEIILAAISSVIFMTGGFFILRSFSKIQRIRNAAVVRQEWQSLTYAKFPSVCNFILKGQINGFGAEGFTKNNLRNDGSFETIQWFTVAYFPIVPLMQHRVRETEKVKKTYIPFFLKGEKTNYVELEKTKLNLRLILKTRLFYFGFIIPSLVLPIVPFIINRDFLIVKFEGPKFWYLILIYFSFGIGLLFLADLFNQKVFLRSSKNQKD